MKTFLCYVRERRRVLLALPVLGAVAWFLFYLYDLPMGALGYILLVSGVVWLLLFVIPGYVAYARRIRKLREQQENVEALLQPMEPQGPLPETLLLETVGSLCRRLREQESEHARRQGDMMAYYTLWVHQIKTPIAALRLILQSRPGESGDAAGQELFKIERYVEMVLGYLRLETISQDLLLESCDVRRTAARAVKKFAPQFIYKKLLLDLEEFSLTAVTDEKWLLFVLEQLLSNAVKYTQSGGVRIFTEGDVLVIRDTGAGISPEDLPRVFQRGFTGQNGRTDTTSTGLGLYLVRRVLDTLQTPIAIRSTPGEGTEVRLDLHRDAPPRD